MLSLDARREWWSRFTTICFDFWKSRPPPRLGWLWIRNWQVGSMWLEAKRLKNSQAHPHLAIKALSEEGFAFWFLHTLEKSVVLFNNSPQSLKDFVAVIKVKNVKWFCSTGKQHPDQTASKPKRGIGMIDKVKQLDKSFCVYLRQMLSEATLPLHQKAQCFRFYLPRIL